MVTVGLSLGPYEILARVGAGGMGEVWRARDHRLHRDVAVKVLAETAAGAENAAARFEREARAVAALSHPNIVAIHDVGTSDGVAYAVMELLEGATLRSRLSETALSLPRALDWAHQIAQGLSAAHERGIVHRDLKPENIFVTRDGVVKILDFGLARVDEPLLGADAKTMEATTPGMVVGTVGYLSPEQARGQSADHRSDVFAFGAVFYEMLCGKAAFIRNTAADSIVAILSDEPRPLAEHGKTVPPEVEEILTHCLEKNRDERFRSARDLAFALRLAMRVASSSGSSSEVPLRATPRTPAPAARQNEISIAVLPFRNIGTSAESEYFADGMTEEIINSISNIPTLQVAARTSSFAFKGREDDVRKIGRQLGVAMVMEGSVRHVGTRLRVSAQLITVDTGYQVWSERWDRDLSDVFAVQDEIAQAIAATFKLRLVESDEAPDRGTQNVEAYDRYLKGRYLLTLRRAGEAIDEFQAAIDIDPDFADAHTALADGWAIRGFYGGVPTWEAWARAAAAVDEAERSSPNSAGVPLSRALLQHYYGWNTAREEEFCRLAIERSPKSAEGWNWLGLCLGLLGRTRDALEATGRGIELEPFHVNIRTSSAWAHLIIGDYDSGERIVRKALDFDPNAAYALWTHGIALRCLGEHAQSVNLFERLVERSSRRLSFYLAYLVASLAAAGERSRAEEVAQELITRRASNSGYVTPLDLATAHVALGDDGAALDALEQAREERNALLWSRIYFPEYTELRSHARWQALAARLGRSAPVELPRN